MAPADPLGLLRDAADTAERLGRALVGQDRIRLAVTGLSRAGKTVLLTSLIANLLAAGQGRRTLPALQQATAGRLQSVRLVPADVERMPRFDAEAHLAALAADPPHWPARTDDLSTLSLQLVLQRQGTLGQLLPPRTVTLELLDYPGEWLLDLPMLRQGYADWSVETLARLRRHGALAREFLGFVDALPGNAPADEALAKRGHILYRDLLRRGRDVQGLRFLQPGRLLNPGPRGEAPFLWFFPLPGQGSELARLLARRYAAYVEDQRSQFFEPYFRRFDRQLVLVDVLGALHAGAEAFADTQAALGAIGAALRRGGGWFDWLLGAPRIAFAATKADHVPERQRDALVALLRGLTGSEEAASHAIAAIRCTEDDVTTLEGKPVAAVRGVLLENRRLARIYPGEVPLKPPGADFWQHGLFAMPAFQPPRLDAAGLSGVPHLHLDSLLAWLIGDLL